VDVKHLKTQSGRLYQFTAIDEATRYRVLKIYDHNSIQSAIHFINEVRQAFPAAIRRIQTDNGSEWGTDFTCMISALPTSTAHPARLPGVQWESRAQTSHRRG
jgi:hypothetical protein